MARQYYVYIMTNLRKTVLYAGVTNDLTKRVWQHRNGQGGGFTRKYHCSKLVLYEVFKDSYNAIAREKQMQASSRENLAPEAIQSPRAGAAGLPRGPADRSQ